MEEVSEEEIIRKIKRGEINYFEFLVNKYSRLVYFYALKKVANREDAEDIVQNAFVKAYKGIDRFDLKQKFYPWFFTIVKNEINEFFRKNKTHSKLDEEMAEDVKEEGFGFEYLIKDLKPEYKQVLQLYFEEGYSYQEIAEKIEKPINTVKTLIRRAKDAVRQKIKI